MRDVAGLEIGDTISMLDERGRVTPDEGCLPPAAEVTVFGLNLEAPKIPYIVVTEDFCCFEPSDHS
jgi:hypothetical protein